MKIQVLASGSRGNCYKISNEDTSLLIEAGLPISEIRRKLFYKLSEIDGVFISHEHLDHAKGVNDLFKQGLDVWTSVGTAVALNNSYLNTFKKHSGVYDFVKCGSFTIQPFEAVHDAEEPVNFLIKDRTTKETLAFITDTAYVRYRLSPINYLMLEVNYIKDKLDRNVYEKSLNLYLRNRIVKNHMSLERALDFLRACDLSACKKIFVLHLSDKNSDADLIEREIKKLTGLPVEIC